MAKSKASTKTEFSDVRTVGIPRAFLYYRYGVMWKSFFEALDREVILTRPSDFEIFQKGDSLSVDECCLASKLFLGHVQDLLGRCDAIFVPCIDNMGRRHNFCTKFQALPDLTRNTFYRENIRVMSLLIDKQVSHTKPEERFIDLAERMGAGPKQARKAYKTALKAQQAYNASRTKEQEKRLEAILKQPKEKRPLAILFAGHPYVLHDPYIGSTVVDFLSHLGAEVLFSNFVNQEDAQKRARDFSKTLPWVINQEIIGSIALLEDKVDGIILASAFPCGPDSMTNDAITTVFSGKPILTLTVDGMSGTAGLETRIESFIDILNYQRKGGYLHAAH
ncbi:MAG: acyl-CoA dehydratase activase-related protein [Eggerthellaceae bacterium]|jgi:predicted nucleotide-binding protein (sugar kinase/HSP70/actin superfamily)